MFPSSPKCVGLYERLTEVSEKLNTMSSSVNSAIEEHNTKIRELNPGVSVLLDRPFCYREDSAKARRLGWQKIKGEWQIVTCRDESAVDSFVALVREERNVRATALRYMPTLLEALIARVKLVTVTVDKELEKCNVGD
jgi:hypothetical protein